MTELNATEKKLWTYIAAGMVNKEIAYRIGTEIGSIAVLNSRLFAKIGCRNRVEAAIKYHGIDRKAIIAQADKMEMCR